MLIRTLVRGEGLTADSAREAILRFYEREEGGEFIQPTVLPGHSSIRGGDSVLFFSFRKDRPPQIVSALFKQSKFDGFDRGDFEPAQLFSDASLKQFHCAETEKYAHVSFFFNGGSGHEFPGRLDNFAFLLHYASRPAGVTDALWHGHVHRSQEQETRSGEEPSHDSRP